MFTILVCTEEADSIALLTTPYAEEVTFSSTAGDVTSFLPVNSGIEIS